MTGPADEDHGIADKPAKIQIRVRFPTVGNTEVDLGARHHPLHVAGVGVVNSHRNAWMLFGEAGDDSGQQFDSHGGQGGDAHPAAAQLGHRADIGDGRLEVGDQALGHGQEILRLLSQVDPAGGAVEQLYPEQFLAQIHRGGQRGL